MTRGEMLKVFALMKLAWPKAPMLCPDKLKETVSLWTFCLPEVDFLTGIMATVQLCRTSHYPPSIAQMREAAEECLENLDREIDDAILSMRNEHYFGHVNRDRMERAVALMGGEERLLIPVDENFSRYDIEGFREAYLKVCQEEAQQAMRALRQSTQTLNPYEDEPQRLE